MITKWHIVALTTLQMVSFDLGRQSPLTAKPLATKGLVLSVEHRQVLPQDDGFGGEKPPVEVKWPYMAHKGNIADLRGYIKEFGADYPVYRKKSEKRLEFLLNEKRISLSRHARLGPSMTAPILAVAFSPDQRHIVTINGDYAKAVLVWDTGTGKLVRRPKTASGTSSLLSLYSNGHKIVTCTSSSTAHHQDMNENRPVITSLACSPDGRFIATGHFDSTIRLWDARTGHPLLKLRGHKRAVYALAFSKDSQYLVSGSSDHTLRLWETRSGKYLHHMKGYVYGIKALAFSPDGSQIASAEQANSIKLWDVATGKRAATIAEQYQITSLAFSPDGELLVAGEELGVIEIWRVSSGKRLHILKGHNGAVSSVAVSRDGKRIVSGSRGGTGGTIKLWERETGRLIMTFCTCIGRKWASFTPKGFYTAPTSKEECLQRVVDRFGNGYSINDEWASVFYRPNGLLPADLAPTDEKLSEN